MMTVSDDVSAVEIDLTEGGLACPGCGGRLRRWGWARPRRVRHGTGWQLVWRCHRPRRARCGSCGATHVLLAVSLAARRADAAAVIAAAVEARVARGQGHRRIAASLARPPSTVRGWLRAFTSSAERIGQVFAALVVRDGPDAAAVWPALGQHGPGRALGLLAAYAKVLEQRLGVGNLTWARAGIGVSGGWLFSGSWWARAGQHQLALTSARGQGPGWAVSPAEV